MSEIYADFYHEQLFGSGKFDWLNKQRGIGLKAIKAFRLGYVGTPAIEAHQRYVGCVTIPYFDARDHERTIRFRSFNGGPKYLSQPGDSPHLFAVRFSEEPVVYIAEGELDAITIWQTGRRAVGVAGASMWSDKWKWLFRNCEEVVVVFDGDEAGHIAQAKIMRSLQVIVPHIRGVEMPPGKDVNDVYRENKRALEALLG